MEGLNRVMLIGNLGADPELRVMQSGQALLKMHIATAETYLDRNGVRQERTEWHSVALWGKRGEALAKFLKKGEKIFVEGSIRTSSYEKDGVKRYRTEIVASNVILAGKKRESGDRTSDRPSERSMHGPAPSFEPPPAEDFGDFEPTADDECPF